MKYRCLRDCYVNDRYHYGDRIYDLPDGFPIHEKNFKLIEEPEATLQDVSSIPLSTKVRKQKHVRKGGSTKNHSPRTKEINGSTN